jgi:two-component system, cell cycle response regulator
VQFCRDTAIRRHLDHLEDCGLRHNRDHRPAPIRPDFRIGRLLCAALLAVTGVYFIEALTGSHGSLDRFFDTWVYNGLLLASSAACLARGILVRAERVPWLLLGAGLSLWTVGDLYYLFALSDGDVIPIPSLSDPFYLAFYPVSYVALGLLLRDRMERFRGNLWLDGLIASLAVAALGAAVIFDEVISTTGGSALVVATNLAYPLADLLLLAFVVAIFGLTDWRVDRTWGLVAGGLAVLAIADSVYLYETAVGTYVEGGTLDVAWPAALVLIACSAWQPTTKLQRVRTESWQALTLPTFFAVLGLALLVYDHFVRINVIALVLASATIAAVIVRAVLTFRDRVRLLAASQEEALSDALTGLGNRRRFVSDVEAILGEEGSDPVSLTVFDLDGFKTYNDSFGHAAGDALLGRVASRLADATDGYGAAYRLGGDEFCVLACATAGPGSLIERAAAALSEEGEGFSVRCSYGSVLMPAEASDLTEALRIADDRMYLQKQRNRPSADRQSIDVLVSVLNERDARLAHHLAGVADLAEAASRRLEVPEPQLGTLRQAAELHDVGKLAIPEEILGKPGPLSEDEWEFVRRHTLIGERILGAAPALGAAAKLVRSTHERWDGTGYPDRLVGSKIPLGARIIAVCDAFDAMTSLRPYAEPLSAEDTIRELFRCAGTQFDPEVVEAFAAVQSDVNAELVA